MSCWEPGRSETTQLMSCFDLRFELKRLMSSFELRERDGEIDEFFGAKGKR